MSREVRTLEALDGLPFAHDVSVLYETVYTLTLDEWFFLQQLHKNMSAIQYWEFLKKLDDIKRSQEEDTGHVYLNG